MMKNIEFVTSLDRTMIISEKLLMTIEQMDNEVPTIYSWVPNSLFPPLVIIDIIRTDKQVFPGITKRHVSGKSRYNQHRYLIVQYDQQ